MTKEERNNRLNEILAIYSKEDISLQSLSDKYEISVPCISRFLKSNNVKIRKIENQKSYLKQALMALKNKSIKEVSEEFGIEEQVLLIANSGLSKSEFKNKIINMAIEEYKNTPLYDKSIAKISSKYGINKKTLSKYLKEKNIEIVANANKSEFNRDFFDNIDTEEKAYWLGFMYADGYIGATEYSVGLSISLKDIEHLKKYNKALNYKKGLNITETHQFGSKEHVNKNGDTLYMVNTIIRDKQLWEGLNSKGCVPNKSLILTFPDESIFSNKKLIYDFIRGYVDGDGTLGVYPHSKTNPKLEESLLIVGTKPFLEGIQKYLGKGYLMHKTNCNENTYRLGYSTSKANKAAELLYKNANIYLDRKYNIYINKFATLKSGKNGEA
jgi:hypothetical protein